MSWRSRAVAAVVLAASVLAAAPAAAVDLLSAYQAIRSQTTWPVQGSSSSDLTSTFGPRIRVSTDAYDWHRGVDIHADEGTPVLAAANGQLWNVTTYVDGGLTIVLRHAFPSPVTYAGKTLTYYYTFYMHLSAVEQELLDAEAAGQHPTVLRGDVIGAVGHSGSAVTDHLHFEMRVGTQCSLEFQIANPTSSCSVGWGFDPAMHSLWMFVPLPSGQSVRVLNAPTNNADGLLSYTSEEDAPLLNRVEYTITDKRNRVLKSHVLDFNQRTGYDPTSTAALDTPDTTKPYMSPVPFGSASQYETQIVIPKTFVGKLARGNRHTVKATDIWGASVSTSW